MAGLRHSTNAVRSSSFSLDSSGMGVSQEVFGNLPLNFCPSRVLTGLMVIGYQPFKYTPTQLGVAGSLLPKTIRDALLEPIVVLFR